MQILVIRPLFYKGVAYAAGATIKADALGAGELIASGRAVLADPADADRINAAVVEHRDRVLGALNASQQQAAAMFALRRRA